MNDDQNETLTPPTPPSNPELAKRKPLLRALRAARAAVDEITVALAELYPPPEPAEPGPEDEYEPRAYRMRPVTITAKRVRGRRTIVTLKGIRTANAGDWLITGVRGELYPCRDDIFRETYTSTTDAENAGPLERPHQLDRVGELLELVNPHLISIVADPEQGWLAPLQITILGKTVKQVRGAGWLPTLLRALQAVAASDPDPDPDLL